MLDLPGIFTSSKYGNPKHIHRQRDICGICLGAVGSHSISDERYGTGGNLMTKQREISFNGTKARWHLNDFGLSIRNRDWKPVIVKVEFRECRWYPYLNHEGPMMNTKIFDLECYSSLWLYYRPLQILWQEKNLGLALVNLISNTYKKLRK